MPKTKQDYRGVDGSVQYRAGGNPPEHAALWFDGERIAWWPAAVSPTEERIRSIFLIWQAQEPPRAALSRDTVLTELREGALYP